MQINLRVGRCIWEERKTPIKEKKRAKKQMKEILVIGGYTFLIQKASKKLGIINQEVF